MVMINVYVFVYFHQNVSKINECRENMNKSYQYGVKYVRLKHVKCLKKFVWLLLKLIRQTSDYGETDGSPWSMTIFHTQYCVIF